MDKLDFLTTNSRIQDKVKRMQPNRSNFPTPTPISNRIDISRLNPGVSNGSYSYQKPVSTADVFKQGTLEDLISSPGKSVKIGNISVSFDKEFNSVRIFSPGNQTVSLKLTTDQKSITEMYSINPMGLVELNQIAQSGKLFSPSALEKLGISKSSVVANGYQQGFFGPDEQPRIPGVTADSINYRIAPPVDKVFSPDVLAAITSGDKNKIVEVGDLKVNFEPEYNVVRVTDAENRVVNFFLNEDRQTIQQFAPNYGGSASTLSQRGVNSGSIFTQSGLALIGISPEAVLNAKKQAVDDARFIRESQTLDLSTLPREFGGDFAKLAAVTQGQGRIFKPGGANLSGLSTFGAGPCLILAVVERGPDGKIKAIGLAHLDGVAPAGSAGDFVNQVKKAAGAENAGKTEIYIVSGEEILYLKVRRSLEAKGFEIKANADLEGNRSDALTVDAMGKVSYPNGSTLDSNLNPKEKASIDFAALTRQVSNAPMDYRVISER